MLCLFFASESFLQVTVGVKKLLKVKKSPLIWQIHILFYWPCEHISSVHFQALMVKKLSYKYYNNQITTRDSGNVQSQHKEESKLNSTINTNSGACTLTHD